MADGYIVAGNRATLATETATKGYQEALIIKYSKDGNVVLAKIFGGSGSELFTKIFKLSDGFIVSGNSDSNDAGFVNKSEFDSIFVKYDDNLNVQWEKSLGADKNDIYEINSVIDDTEGYTLVGGISNDQSKWNTEGNNNAFMVKFISDEKIKKLKAIKIKTEAQNG